MIATTEKYKSGFKMSYMKGMLFFQDFKLIAIMCIAHNVFYDHSNKSIQLYGDLHTLHSYVHTQRDDKTNHTPEREHIQWMRYFKIRSK